MTDPGTGRGFDPATVRDQLSGCVLCGDPIVTVGLYVPHEREHDDLMRSAVTSLRVVTSLHVVATVPGRASALAYGLCENHQPRKKTVRRLAAQVEAAIRAAAARVTIQ